MKTIPFDWFIDTVPQVVEHVQQAEKRGKEEGKVEGKIEGKVEGKAEGELQALRQVVLDTVEDRFPDLVDLAQTEVIAATQPQLLHKLIRDLNKTSDVIKVFQMLKQVRQGA
jgi:flagellar biosynthesis/type III secretory pathway protein FliH